MVMIRVKIRKCEIYIYLLTIGKGHVFRDNQ